jgi:hypothetical protein
LILRDVFRSAREETYGSTEIVELGLRKQEKRRSGFGFKIAGPNRTSTICRKMIFQQLVLNALDNSLQAFKRITSIYTIALARTKPIILGKEDLKYKTMPGKITFMLFWTLWNFIKARKDQAYGTF